jgi:hypothetical protein
MREFMVEGMQQGTASNQLVVFAQDIVPETILEDPYSNNTFREYLEAGGSVLWIGDIPFYYVGKEGEDAVPIWETGAPAMVLGVNPVFAHPGNRVVSFTRTGKQIGLARPWTGIRPIVVQDTIEVLAFTKGMGNPMFSEPSKGVSFWQRIGYTIKSEFGGGIIPAKFVLEATVKEQSVKTVDMNFYGKFASAWFKNFLPVYHWSGFYRIWDYGPRHITDVMLLDLQSVVQSIHRRFP